MFTGPVFVVGAARSGTKLLRDLTNRHPEVHIPEVETELVPWLARRYGEALDLGSPRRRAAFARDVRESAFGLRCARRGLAVLTEAELAAVDPRSWPAVFEAVCRASEGAPRARVWGDKSPGYTERVALLARLFPAARFVHIVRDPRAVALSVRTAWGKDPVRNAEKWVRAVAAVDAAALGGRLLELRFEDLTADPEPVMRAVAAHLDLDFDPAMLRLERPAERGGTTRLDASAARKWSERLPAAEVRRVEEIAWSLLARFGYAPEQAAGPRPLATWERGLGAARDAVAMTRARVREDGLRGGLRLLRAASRRG